MDTSDDLTGSKDGPGAGDRDLKYEWDHPKACLTTLQLARLLIMRGEILDYRAGVRGGAADGDLAYTVPRESGLLLVDDSRP